MNTNNFRKARFGDLRFIEWLLDSEGLPFVDCEDHIENFIVAEYQETIVGCGGLEVCGEYALIRSVVTARKFRNRGLARETVRVLQDKARNLKLKQMFLLTETASEYFGTLGFKATARANVPQPVRGTMQFKELCPDSAVAMMLML